MPDNVLRIERQDKIAVLTLNRPDRLNALSPELRQALEQACQDIRHDDDIWAVVLTGEGRGFCSGVDLRALQRAADDLGSRQERLDMYGWTGRQAVAVYRILDKPIVAAVNGVAAGAGMSLALACDLRVGSPLTRFKTVFLERSLSPDSGMSFFLPRIVGYSRACDLIYTSRFVEAEEAHRIGLLDRLVPPRICWKRPWRWRGKSPPGRQWRCRPPAGCCSRAWIPTWKRNCVTSPTASSWPAGHRMTSRNHGPRSRNAGRPISRGDRVR